MSIFGRDAKWRTVDLPFIREEIQDYLYTWCGIYLIPERQFVDGDYVACAYSIDDIDIKKLSKVKSSQGIMQKWVSKGIKVDTKDHIYDVIFWVPSKDALKKESF